MKKEIKEEVIIDTGLEVAGKVKKGELVEDIKEIKDKEE